ncbi:gas vesicle protein GvpJ [Haloarcula nitratireducens]|uniref:Gas vesicle protein n=1 Tax=Haloarcula nitratireducens TaxID=2487749 RepID=A0AAW4PEN8_9EURY|nr:gas vesicle protein [Halomicroarcula nitratireducens]MBX0296212.1 gas vesicle protein [Halomicroarcula nitratireducens]
MPSAGPTRSSADLADVVELLLDKGLVINADIAVSVGDTELLGIQIRAAVASFETAAQYGLEFPEGTDQERIEQVANQGRLGPPSDTSEDDDDAAERPDVSPGSHPKQIRVAQSGGGSPGGPAEEADAADDADESADADEESADEGADEMAADDADGDATADRATAEETEGENDDG